MLCHPCTGRCDPWAFAFPTLQDGTQSPAAAVAAVQLEKLAGQLASAMFQSVPDNSEGLLLSLTFDSGGAVAGAGGAPLELGSGSGWSGPPGCAASGSYSDVCPGCNPFCAFGNCLAYNCTCLDRALSDTATTAAAQASLARGVCACRDVVGCPSAMGSCSCPSGLARVCMSCGGRGVCGGGPAEDRLCLSDSDCGSGGHCAPLDPRFCPSTVCERWACDCFPSADGGNATGYLGMRASSDRSSGKGSCTCAGGLLLDMPVLPGAISGLDVALPPYVCCITGITGSAGSVLYGVPCWRWNSSGSDLRCVSPQQAAMSTTGGRDCLLARCCSYPPTSSRRLGPTGAWSQDGVGRRTLLEAEELFDLKSATGPDKFCSESDVSPRGGGSDGAAALTQRFRKLRGRRQDVCQAKAQGGTGSAQHSGQPARRAGAVACAGAAYVTAQLLAAGSPCLSPAVVAQLQDQIIVAAAGVNVSVGRGSIAVQSLLCTNSTPGRPLAGE